MNNPMKRKEDVNRRGRANLEQTKAGKVEIQREITSREDSRHAPTLQCSKCTISLSAILAYVSLARVAWGRFDKGIFFSFLKWAFTFGESKGQPVTKLFNTSKEIHT